MILLHFSVIVVVSMCEKCGFKHNIMVTAALWKCFFYFGYSNTKCKIISDKLYRLRARNTFAHKIYNLQTNIFTMYIYYRLMTLHPAPRTRQKKGKPSFPLWSFVWWQKIDIERQIIYENDIYKYSVDITVSHFLSHIINLNCS